jgi:hypothetical protein
MTCDQAREIIALSRPGETGETETRALMEHLESCALCAQLYRDALSLNERIAVLRAVEPELEDPEGLIRSVMQIVDETPLPQRPVGRLWRASALRGLLRDAPGHSAPLRLRSVAFACAAALIAVFLAQTTLDARKLAALELRLGRITVGTAAAGIAEPGQVFGLIPPGDARNRLLVLFRSGALRNTLNDQEVRAYLESLRSAAGVPGALPRRSGLLQSATPGDQAVIVKALDTLLTRGGIVHEH